MPTETETGQAPFHCCTSATPGGDGLYSLRFCLVNSGTEPIDLPSYEPFTAFNISATADGKALTVHEPALDIPVNPTTLHVPSGSSLTLETPIQLRISEGAEPGDDGFIWTIAHDKGSVSLQVRLSFPAPFDTICPVTLSVG